MTASHTISVRRRLRGAEDAHGNPVTTWASAINVAVYSVAPAYSNEPFEAGREAVITGYTVLAPLEAKALVSSADVVVLHGEEYTVEGEVAAWNMGPFGYAPGVSFALKRVEG